MCSVLQHSSFYCRSFGRPFFLLLSSYFAFVTSVKQNPNILFTIHFFFYYPEARSPSEQDLRIPVLKLVGNEHHLAEVTATNWP